MALSFPISKFDPTTLKPTNTVLVLGSRGSGKSTVMYDFMYHLRDAFDYGVAICSTEDTSGELARFIPMSCIYSSFNEQIIHSTLSVQKNLGRRKKEAGVNNNHYLFVFMDDCGFEKGVLKSRAIREVFNNGRHHNIFLIYASQYAMDIPTAIRGNVDIVIACDEPTRSNRQRLHEHYFGVFKTFRDFDAAMDRCTTNHGVLVFNKTIRSPNPGDRVFWYKAQRQLPEFKVCRPVYFKMHNLFHVEEHNGMDETGRIIVAL